MTLRDNLNKLIGEWQSEGVVIDGGEYNGTKIRGTDKYEWLGEHFIVHTAEVLFGDNPQKTVEIFKVNDNSFDMTAYNQDGSVEAMHGTFDENNVYHAGDDKARATLTFLEDGTKMQARWEAYTSGKWVDWIDMTFRK